MQDFVAMVGLAMGGAILLVVVFDLGCLWQRRQDAMRMHRADLSRFSECISCGAIAGCDCHGGRR